MELENKKLFTAEDYLHRHIRWICQHSINRECPYYPCHRLPQGQAELNCLFCFCPFYPCGNEKFGGKWIGSGEKRVWDCSECNFIHRHNVVQRILELFYKGLDKNEIYQQLLNEFSGDK